MNTMSNPPSNEFATVTALDKLRDDDESELAEVGTGMGLHPLVPPPGDEAMSRASSPMPGFLDPDSAIDRTTPNTK